MPSPSLPPLDEGVFDFALRYQRTPGAQYHARPLSLLQQDVLYRCDGRVTVADLADATLYTHPEIRAVLNFLTRHGLVKTLPAEAWLFEGLAPLSAASSCSPSPERTRRFWSALKGKMRVWNDQIWYRLTWDVHMR